MPRIQLPHPYQDIISVENILGAWTEFLKGKRGKWDVQEFSAYLMHHVTVLHTELRAKTYEHGGYAHFRVADPKPRDIHKASVRDRLLHHALYRKLYPFFDKAFIADSFSCRTGKGTHAAMDRFQRFAVRVSKNNTRTCFVLKCDIRKFFASIDHAILLLALRIRIGDEDVLWLLERVITSFSSGTSAKGLPLGNLTSQLLVNVYMNEFDQFVKHRLKVRQYIRYADDFVFLSDSKTELEQLLPQVSTFLQQRLKLELHPDKVYIRTLASGVDFLGWVHFPDYRVLRTVTKRRILKRLRLGKANQASFKSSLGLVQYGNAYRVRKQVEACAPR